MPKKEMTAKWIKGLPLPEKGRKDYQDTVLPGLILRVSASGRKSFSVSYHDGQKRPRVTLGVTKDSPKTGPRDVVNRISLADARERAEEVLAEATLGMDPAEQVREAKKAITFSELAAVFMQRHARRRKVAKSAREDERRIEKVLNPRWGERKAGSIRRRDVVDVLDVYEDRGHTVARNRMAALISKIFSVGLDRDEPGLDSNPAAGLIKLDREKPRSRYLSDEELKVVLPLFETEGMAGLGIQLLLLTAARPKEVFETPWEEIDTERALWRLPWERTKIRHHAKKKRNRQRLGEHHEIPLSPQALQVLEELRAMQAGNTSKWVFPSPRGDQPFLGYQKAGRRIREASYARGVEENWRIYPDLRTTVLTRLGKKPFKVPPHVLGAIAGHIPSDTTTRHYALADHLHQQREALDAWGAHLDKLDPNVLADVVAIR